MEHRRLLLYILAPVVIPAAVWLFGVAVRGSPQDQGGAANGREREGGAAAEAQERGAGNAARIAGLQARVRDLIDRHPDYDLGEAHRLLRDLERPLLRLHAGALDGPEARARELELELRRTATGLDASMENWDQALEYKSFSPNGFRDFYERVRYAGTSPRTDAPPITGDPAADRRIVGLAVARGYRLRAGAAAGELERQDGHALQPQAFAAWRALQAAARAEALQLGLVSSYRSVERQRRIFLAALERAGVQRQGSGPSPSELASGRADALVEAVLRVSSPPGFSRHHTGYTIDITDLASGEDFTDFGRTSGFEWISRHNYLNAKRFGFLPSYPEGAAEQGPDTEPWEYVWVGTGVLREPAGQVP